jgi:hypothetical protein
MHPLVFTKNIVKLMTCAFINGKTYIKEHPAISKRSSVLRISEYKEVSYSDEMGTKIL